MDIQIIDSSDTLFRTQNVYIVIIVFFHNRVENTYIYIVDRSNITQITSKPPKAHKHRHFNAQCMFKHLSNIYRSARRK